MRASDVANAAYLGNALSSLSTVSALLDRSVDLTEVPGTQTALDALQTQVTEPLPTEVSQLPAFSPLLNGKGQPKGHQQHILSQLVHATNQAKLFANQTNLPAREKLRLLAVARPDAGLWLEALPSRALGLKFSKEEFRRLLRWWLGAPQHDR